METRGALVGTVEEFEGPTRVEADTRADRQRVEHFDQLLRRMESDGTFGTPFTTGYPPVRVQMAAGQVRPGEEAAVVVVDDDGADVTLRERRGGGDPRPPPGLVSVRPRPVPTAEHRRANGRPRLLSLRRARCSPPDRSPRSLFSPPAPVTPPGARAGSPRRRPASRPARGRGRPQPRPPPPSPSGRPRSRRPGRRGCGRR